MNWGPILNFVNKTNYKSLHPQAMRIQIIKQQIHLKIFILKTNLEVNTQIPRGQYMNTSRQIFEQSSRLQGFEISKFFEQI